MRRSTVYISVTVSGILFFCAMVLHASYAGSQSMSAGTFSQALVKNLRLTDLCLVTEARYTRHPAMADLHSAFQDHPIALDHFPSGSLIGPPDHLRPHVPTP